MATIIHTPDELLEFGLLIAGFSIQRQQVCRKTLIARFVGHYGAKPVVYSELWEDFQTTTIAAARIQEKDLSLNYFFMTLVFLKSYLTESQLSGMFRVSEKTARTWIRFYVAKIQALKPQKVQFHLSLCDELKSYTHFSITIFLCVISQIFFPENFGNILGFDCIMSVDGTHCAIREPKHPIHSKDPAYFSHKSNHAGLNYEIALSLIDDRIVWVSGPHPAGTPDIQVFRNGLMAHIPNGKRIIGDKGYRGEPNYISTPNSFDNDQVKLYKSRARARHETINSRIKSFKCLSERFHHSNEFHGKVFEAICVITQYQLDNGSFLFPVAV